MLRSLCILTFWLTVVMAPAYAEPAASVGIETSEQPTAARSIPVRGRPVPELDTIEPLVVDWMEGASIEAAVVGLMLNDTVIYLRGFGWLHEDVPMIENAKVRLASIAKPITAAMIRELIRDPAIDLALNDYAFNLGQSGGGVLNVNPWPSLGDTRLRDITIDNLLRHRGGWKREDAGDHTARECQIASEMDINSPPGRTNTMRWILGQELINDPGTYHYSNEGYLALTKIVQARSPLSYIPLLRSRVLTSRMGVPATEIERASTLQQNVDYREPVYLSGTCRNCNVFTGCDNWLLSIERAYGQRHLETRLGWGGLIASAPAVLRFANNYRVGRSASIGRLLTDAPIAVGNADNHGGAQSGVSTYVFQNGGGFRAFIFFNRNVSDSTAQDFWDQQLSPALLNISTWPTESVDGAWTSVTSIGTGGYGAYDQPFQGLTTALNRTSARTRIRLHPGSTSWTGTISTPRVLDAPLGTVRIGE